MKTVAYDSLLSKIVGLLLLVFACTPFDANGAKLELVRAGLVQLNGSDFASPSHIKAMYPVIAEDHLVFLLVNEQLGREGDIIYSVPLSGIFSKKTQIPKPRTLSIPKKGGVFSDHVHKLFYSIYSDGTSVRQEGSKNTLLDTVSKLKEEKFLSPPRDLKRSKNSLSDGLLLQEGALKEKKKKIFECGDPISFSERKLSNNERALIVNFFDRQNVPRFAKLGKKSRRKGCGESLLSGMDGFEPKISPRGKFFSFLKINKRNPDQSDLYVHNYKNLKTIRKVSNVKLYDIKVHDFNYKNSTSWIHNERNEFLYYIPDKPRNRVIGRIKCQKSCGHPQRLKVPSCFYLDPPFDPKEQERVSDEWQSDISIPGNEPTIGWMKGKKESCRDPGAIGIPVLVITDIIWTVPFVYNGKRYLAAQAVVSSSFIGKKNEPIEQSWAPRILILQSNK